MAVRWGMCLKKRGQAPWVLPRDVPYWTYGDAVDKRGRDAHDTGENVAFLGGWV